MLAATRASGAHGLIQEIARRAIEAAAIDPSLARKYLALRNSLYFREFIEDDGCLLRLYWREGVLQADIVNITCQHDLLGGMLTVLRLFPVKAIAARPGKRLGRLVKDHLIPESSIVVSAHRDDWYTYLQLDVPEVPFFL